MIVLRAGPQAQCDLSRSLSVVDDRPGASEIGKVFRRQVAQPESVFIEHPYEDANQGLARLVVGPALSSSAPQQHVASIASGQLGHEQHGRKTRSHAHLIFSSKTVERHLSPVRPLPLPREFDRIPPFPVILAS